MSYNTIKLKKYADIINEYEAAGTILPGSVLELTSAGKVQPHSVSGGPAAVIVALEDELQGKTVRDSYAEGDQVQTWYVQPGEEFLAVVASSYDPAVGALLAAGTNGQLKAVSTGVAQFQAIAAKEIDEDGNHRVAVRRL